MWLLKSDKILFAFFLLCCFQVRAQEVINDVSIEKADAGSYKVQYRLSPGKEFDVNGITLKIYRRRDGKVEEVFSKQITPDASTAVAQKLYTYMWTPENGLVKTGDELQARIAVALQPSIAGRKAMPNKKPYADAGNTLEVDLPVNKPIVLNGSKSYDEDGKIVLIQWKQIAGPTNVNILKADSLIAYLNGDFKPGTYAFELSVKDDKGGTDIGRTILRVKAAPLTVMTPQVNDKMAKDSSTALSKIPAPEKSRTKLKGGPYNAAVNLLLPGVGHYFVSGDYNGENRKAASFVLTAVYAGSIGGAFYFRSKSNSDYKKYTELANFREYQKDANGIVIGIRGAREADANRYFNSAKSSHRNALICLGVGGGILVGDLVYTFLKGNKNRKEWKKDATSFHPKLFISSDGYSTTAGIQIRF